MTTTGATIGARSGSPWQAAVILVLAACLAAALMGEVYPVVVGLAVVLATVGLGILPLTWSLPILVFLVPFRLYVDLPGTEIEVATTNFLLVGLGGICLANLLLRGRPRLLPWELLVVAWVLWTVASVAWSMAVVASLRGVLRWMMTFSAILLAAQCVLGARDPAIAARRLLMAVLWLVGAWSVIGFIEVAVGLDPIVSFFNTPVAWVFFPPLFLKERVASLNFNWRSGNTVQPFGPFINAIEFGILTAVGVGIALALAVARSRLAPRRLVLSVLVLASAANIACMKGTGWLAAGVAVAVAFLSLGRSLRRVIGVSVLVLAIVGLLAYAFREELTERIQALAVREGAQGATAEALSRPAIWLYYLSGLKSRPVAGSGINTSILYGPIHWTRAPGGNASVAVTLPTENSYLTAAIETGLVGLGLLVATLVGALGRGLRLARRNPTVPLAQAAGAAAIGLAAILAGNLTVDAFSGEILGVLGGIFVGVILAANRLLSRPQTVRP